MFAWRGSRASLWGGRAPSCSVGACWYLLAEGLGLLVERLGSVVPAERLGLLVEQLGLLVERCSLLVECVRFAQWTEDMLAEVY